MYHGLWDINSLLSGSRCETWSPGVSLCSPLRSHRDEVPGVDFLACLSRSGAPRAFFPGSVWPPVLGIENVHS